MALRWCVCIVSVIIVVYVDPSTEEPTVKPHTPVKPSYSSDITNITDIEDDNDEVIHEQREATMPGKPKWSSRKPDHEAIARPAYSYVKMNCQAFGLPKPKIKWLFNGQSFESSVAGQWNMKGYTLTLGHLVPKDSGSYTCIVSNNFGSINWTYTLQVLQRLPHAPVIDGPKNQTVAVGEDAVFNCKIVFSDLHPDLQWLQHFKVNGSYTTPEGDPYVTVLQTSNMNMSKPGQLIIRNVTAEMAGWYTCVVQNSIGIEYGSAWLTVIDEHPVTPDRIRTNTTASHGIPTTIPLIAGGSAASLLIMLLIGIFIFVWFRKKKHLSMPCNTRFTKQEPTSV